MRLECLDGHTSVPVVDGVTVFVDSSDFYDRYAEDHCVYQANPGGRKEQVLRWLPFWSWREWRLLREQVPDTGTLLELGCGRGRQLFAERSGRTLGLDVSHDALQACATRYDAVALASLPKIPVGDGEVDVLVSAHVIGHIADSDKATLFSEMARVVRPGGSTVHIVETSSTHPAVVAAWRQPDAYRDRFVDQHGHIGLEPAATVLDRFDGAGFDVGLVRVVDAVIPSVQNVRTFFDHDDLADVEGLRVSRALDRATARSRVANVGYEVAMGTFHRTVEQWVGRPDRAQFLHVVATRRP